MRQPELESLLDRFGQGDRLALARLVSYAARGEYLDQILGRLAPHRPARVVAITGSAGVGKSTLVGKLIEEIRRHDRRVAVLACDPQSPLSGGALLGDRFRMPSRPDDDGVYIRSLAAPGGQGAVASHIDALLEILAAFGFEVILLETVGAGQGDTIVRDLADVVVLLLQPETGDDLQWEKAGVLEIAEVVAIHKADLPGAERVEAQVRGALDLASGANVQIVRVSSKTGEGLAALWHAIEQCPLRRHAAHQQGRELLRLAQQVLAERFTEMLAQGDRDLQQLLERWQHGQVPASEAGPQLLNLLGARGNGPSNAALSAAPNRP